MAVVNAARKAKSRANRKTGTGRIDGVNVRNSNRPSSLSARMSNKNNSSVGNNGVRSRTVSLRSDNSVGNNVAGTRNVRIRHDNSVGSKSVSARGNKFRNAAGARSNSVGNASVRTSSGREIDV